MVIKECVVCGKEFDAKGNRKTCNKECSKEHIRQYHKQYRLRRAPHPSRHQGQCCSRPAYTDVS